MQIAIRNNLALKFGIRFIVLFLTLYYFNILFFGITQPGGHYIAFLAGNVNYISWLRWALLHASAAILNALGYTAIVSDTQLLVAGHYVIRLVYTCLGLGVMSFFAAFVIAYPKLLKPKLLFLLSGVLVIQVLNILRLMLLALFWDRSKARIIDHHVIFDVFIYVLIAVALYRWINHKRSDLHATH